MGRIQSSWDPQTLAADRGASNKSWIFHPIASTFKFHISNSIIVGPADPCYRPWCLQQVLKFSSQRFHVQIPQNHSNSIIVGPTDPCCRPWCFQQGVVPPRKNERGARAERGSSGYESMTKRHPELLRLHSGRTGRADHSTS